ncbi:hypothetical protein E2C01_003477 [Portunus trituberculatus]|uniref:Uncharacterized protein n=1 Tax=Portunus trituberculatus TaxID=210409 RepID=A0A5B7CTN1_PORTR|nr:hypothetical protein [Portunus trituberculatus]
MSQSVQQVVGGQMVQVQGQVVSGTQVVNSAGQVVMSTTAGLTSLNGQQLVTQLVPSQGMQGQVVHQAATPIGVTTTLASAISQGQSGTGTCGCQDLALMSYGLTNEHPPQKLTSNGWHSSERPSKSIERQIASHLTKQAFFGLSQFLNCIQFTPPGRLALTLDPLINEGKQFNIIQNTSLQAMMPLNTSLPDLNFNSDNKLLYDTSAAT